MPGTLYVVAVPIGNLGDLSPRAAEVLRSVDEVASESPDGARRLLSSQGISAKVTAYREAGREAAARGLLERLGAGASVALLAEAGTPAISDPGWHLVAACHEAGIAVEPVPGPSALVAALSAAGIPARRFVFEGFLPRSGSARRRALRALSGEPRTIVVFESPHRLRQTLEDLLGALGDRSACLARELTKKFEEIRVARLSAFLEEYQEREPRGEYVLVLEGAGEPEEGSVDAGELREAARWLRGLGLSARQASEVMARFMEVGRREAYRLASLESRSGEAASRDDRQDSHEG